MDFVDVDIDHPISKSPHGTTTMREKASGCCKRERRLVGVGRLVSGN